MRVFEEYTFKWINKEFTIRLLANGEHRCSCKGFKKQPYSLLDYCYHVKMFHEGKIKDMSMRRFI